MDIRTGAIVAIFACLLVFFLSIRAGFRSLQYSRRLASWPARRSKIAAGRRYFGLAFFLLALVIAGSTFVLSGKSAGLLLVPSRPAASPEPTRTVISPETQTVVSSATGEIGLQGTPTMTSTPSELQPAATSPSPAGTFTGTPGHFSTQTPLPTDTHWPTWTSSNTSTATPIPSSTLTPTRTSTRFPTQTPIPTDTHWPTLTASKTPTATPTFSPSWTPTGTSTRFPTWTPIPTDTH